MGKIIARAALAGLGLILALLLAVWLVVPRLIDLAALKTQIVAQLSAQLGAEVTIATLRVPFWPLPHATLDGVRFSAPAAVDGTLATVSVYPRLLPLLRGKLQLASLHITRPDIQLQLARRISGAHASPATQSVADVKAMVGSALATLSSVAASQAPGLLVMVDNGSVILSRHPEPLLSFTGIHGSVRLAPDRVAVDLACFSNVWERTSLTVSLDPIAVTGTGRIDLIGLRPRQITGYILPESDVQLGDSEVNLVARLQLDGLNALRAEVEGSMPALVLHRGAATLAIKGDSLKAAVLVDENATNVTLTNVRLDSPHLQLSGKVTVDHTAALASLELMAKDVDVPSVREAATVLAGGSTLTRKIFDVVRGGKVPQLAVHAKGRSLSELGRGQDALVIQGKLVEGRIHVPEVDLDFDRVTGQAHVANNVLSGEQITAKLGKSRVLSAALRVGLEGDAPELHVDAMAQADATELAALLKRLITSASIVQLLDRVSDVEGTMSGKLSLNGTTKTVNPTADISQVEVSANVQGIPRPLRIEGAHVVYDGGGIAATNLQVEMKGADLTGHGDLRWTSEQVDIRGLHLHDAYSDAKLALLMKSGAADVQFAGFLDKRTLDTIVPDNHVLGGWVRGDFRTRIFVDQPYHSTLHGTLEAQDVFIPGDGEPVRVERLSLDATTDLAHIDAAIDDGANGEVHVHGSVRPSAQAFVLDLDLTAGHLEWSKLEHLLPRGAEDSSADAPFRDLPLRGTLRIAAESFSYGRFTWKPVRAAVVLATNASKVIVTEAGLCGIATPGQIVLTAQGLKAMFKPGAQRQQLDTTLTCLANEKGWVTGAYTLAADIRMHGPPAEIGKSLRGHVDFIARDGRSYHMGVMAKVFSTLSVVTGSLANLPDLASDGLPYDTLRIKGDLHGATLTLSESVMEGPTVKMVGEGSVNLSDRTVDLTVVAAPLRSVDSVVGRIPIIGGVLGGSLISIPVKVTGTLDNPEVIPLPPSAVGKGLLGLMTRTLELPFHMIQPLLPSTKTPQN